jgi:lambda family phage tail tape measure protein
MPKKVDDLNILIKFKDAGSVRVIEKVSNSIRHLESSVKNTKPDIVGLRTEIMNLSQKGTKNIATLNAQRSSLKALRDEAKIGSTTFKQLTADVAKLDKQLEKTQGRQNRGNRALRATQTAGAVISGGIFGGPEGAIGGLLGAPFGVEGAFAGAAIGAATGGIRRSIGGTADYAAQIEKLKIALQGVAGPQENYRSALAAAADVTARLNVPQEQSIAGITRLTAAVKGAGGPIADAETTFKNVTAAIKATGGSTEDVKGAITAMVQVFSKGKVSAEELSGQLGERLPGAVTMFAKANRMTLPELQENLKKGTVGLNELMNFIVALGDKFNGTAEQMSASNADAGARLTVVVDNMRADLGRALIPIGAQFQEAFAEFIQKIAPTLVDVLPKIAQLVLNLTKAFDKLVVAAGAFFAVLAIGKIIAFAKAAKDLAGVIFLLKLNTAGATTALAAMNLTALANPYVALAAGVAAFSAHLYNAAQEQKRLNLLIKEGTVAEIDKEIASLRAEQTRLDPLAHGSGGTVTIQGETRDSAGKAIAKSRYNEIRGQIQALEDSKPRALYDENQGKALPASLLPRFKYDPITGDGGGGGGGGGGRGRSEKADASQRLVDLTNSLALSEENVGKRVLITKKYMIDRQKVLESGLKGNRLEVALADKLKTFRQSIFALNKQEAEEATRNAEAQAQADAERQDRIEQARVLAGEITQEEYDRTRTLKEMRELLGEQSPLYQKIKDKLTEIATPLDRFKAGLQELIKESGNLADSLAVAGVNAISQLGEELANFVATGKADFRSLTVSILQDMARIAAQSAFTNALSGIMNIFGGGGGGGGGGGTGLNLDMIAAYSAKGNVFAQNKIVPYAMGGVVTKPTLFQFANGGAGRLGIMGEAGAEAILPLKRGANGKLGVEAQGGGNIVVNVDAKGTTTEGNAPNANMLGKLIGNAVQAELVKQRRPGGILA